MPPLAGRASATTHYAKRVAGLAASHPLEFMDRLLARLEQRRERDRPPDRFPVAADPIGRLHDLLGFAMPCDMCAEFPGVWAEAALCLENTGREVGRGHDADMAVARAAWTATLHLRPTSVVETGVARGITSRMVLSAMQRLGHGTLYSVDLPPILDGWYAESAIAVPPTLRERWILVRGSSRRHLRGILARLGGIDLFIHDSLHTESTMGFEFEQAWPRLRTGGLLIADDVHANHAFRSFVLSTGAGAWFVGADSAKDGCWGVVRKDEPAG